MQTNNLLCKLHLGSVLLLLLAFGSMSLFGQQPDAGSAAGSNKNTSNKDDKQESTKISDNLKWTFEIGGQYKNVAGERPTKFEEFSKVPKGLMFRNFRVSSNPPGSRSFFRAIGRGIGEIDENFYVDFGQYGKFRTTFSWSETPHLYSRGARSLFTRSGGVLAIDDAIQTTLQNTPDASLPAAITSIYATAPAITLKTKRGALDFNQTVQINKEFSIFFNWTRNQRTGNRPMGTGSYSRVGTATGDTFLVHSIEIPEPIDYVSDQVSFGARYVAKKWGLNFQYVYSNFSNDIPSLTFDNPTRITDLQATGTGGAFDRMKFARGLMALPPSNSAQSILISGFFDLPANTRIAGAIGWSFWRQDEAFVPYTLNSAIVTGVPAGVNPTLTSSLPKQSLDGRVDVLTQDYLMASRPWKSWTFNLHFKDYAHENKTEEILFAGYAAYTESYWRTNIAGVPIRNEPASFFRKSATAEAVWDITKTLRWKIEYGWEGWVRRNRQVGRTNEYSFATQLSYRPTAKFNTKLNYKYSDRVPQRYDPGVKEFSKLRMFDQARRLQHDADLQWQWSIKPKVGLSGTIGYLSDDYDQNFYGLSRNSQIYGTVDLMYMPKDNATFYANYSREQYKTKLQTLSKTGAPYAVENSWNRDQKDTVDSFGLGYTSYLMKEKLLLDTNYSYSFGKTKTTTVNLFTPLANSVLNATAFPFPDVTTRFQEFSSDISYQVADNWALGVRYAFQPYRLDDFALNNLSPYPVTQLPAEQDGRRWLLLDSRYSSHDAHVVSVYIRFDR